MDMILFGPGVTAVTTAYVRKENQLNIFDNRPSIWYYMSENSSILDFFYIITTV